MANTSFQVGKGCWAKCLDDWIRIRFFLQLVEEGSVEERMKICMEIVSWRFLEVVFSFVKWMLMDGWGRLNEVLELKLHSEGGDDDDSCGQGFPLRVSSCLNRCNVS